MRAILLVPAVLVLLFACTSSPMDRRQVVLYSDADMARRGEETYRHMQAEIPATDSVRETQYVQCVANYVIAALEPEERNKSVWEVTVFDNDQANAFALPGGKIGVYNGLLKVATNQDQLAAVLAHEVGHVLADHSNERASQTTLRNVGLATAQVLGASSATLDALDLGSQLGLFLPFNRIQESEADSIGVLLMARAGFDPTQSITLWQNMNANGGPRSPELLSTHPSPQSRMAELNRLMGPAEALQKVANARGLNPDCMP